MKFLQCPNLSYLNSMLDGADAGDSVLSAKLEAYSCKSIKTDKRLSHQIERRLEQEAQFDPMYSPKLMPMPESPCEISTLTLDNSLGSIGGHSPLERDPSGLSIGTGGKCNAVQTYTYLVLCLNHCYNQEFDFSCIPREDIRQDESLSSIKSHINSTLEKFSSATRTFRELEEEFWNAVNDVVTTAECEFYSYLPEEGEDPIHELEIDTLWSKHYFLYNRKLKKILLFRCWAQSKAVSRGENPADYLSADDDELPLCTPTSSKPPQNSNFGASVYTVSTDNAGMLE